MNDQWLGWEKGNGCCSCYSLVRTVLSTGHLTIHRNHDPWVELLARYLTTPPILWFIKTKIALVYNCTGDTLPEWSSADFFRKKCLFSGASVVCSVHPWEYLAGPYKPKDGGWGGNPFCWLPGSKDASHLVTSCWGVKERNVCSMYIGCMCMYIYQISIFMCT